MLFQQLQLKETRNKIIYTLILPLGDICIVEIFLLNFLANYTDLRMHIPQQFVSRE
jgi:ABC-type maltose transport system permease subunit